MRSASSTRLDRPEVGERRVHRDVDRLVVRGVERVAQLLHHLDGLQVVVVHLPVAAHQRLAAGSAGALGAPLSAARPGRSPCSRYSSDAPPPVDTWSTAAGEAELGQRGRAVAAADDGEARGTPPPLRRPRACLPRTARPRTRPWGRSRTRCPPRRPRRRTPPPSPARCRAPSSPPGRRAPTVRTSVAVGARGHHDVGRHEDRLRPARSSRQVSTWSASSSESPTSWPWAREEREAHAAADEERVDPVEQGADDAELVAHLGAAQHGDERAGAAAAAGRPAPRPRARAAAPRRWGAGPEGRRSTRGPGARSRRRR